MTDYAIDGGPGLVQHAAVWREVAAAGPLAVQRLDPLAGAGVLVLLADRSMVDVAIDKAGRGHRRDRMLPAWVTVYLVFALCVFSGEGYASVLRQVWPCLTRLRGRAVAIPHASAVPKARARLGAAPLQTLFEQAAGPVAPAGMAGAFAFGLRLVAIDGTVIDVPDSADNDAAFGRYAGSNGQAALPQVRLSMLIECGTHAVIGARFDGTQISEQVQSDHLLGCLQPGMLQLADRNYFSFQRWHDAAGTGAHLLWRFKTGSGKGVPKLPVVTPLPDGSYLSRIKETTAARRQREKRTGAGTEFLDYHTEIIVRVIEFTIIVVTSHGKTRRERYRLITTLLDPADAGARSLADLYRQRWESETGFGHFKTRLRGPRTVLRSQHPEGVHQEIYAYLCVYQAICRLATTTAHTTGADCDQISFTVLLRALRRAITTNQNNPHHLITEATDQLLPPRRNRVSDRQPKGPQRQPRTHKAHYHTEIHLPAQTP